MVDVYDWTHLIDKHIPGKHTWQLLVMICSKHLNEATNPQHLLILNSIIM